tara:strand:- start:29 stop:1396 length:1368 start_codon:yes stop_codon:yes gene_type:complete
MFDSDKKNSELCEDDNVVSNTPEEEILFDVISDSAVSTDETESEFPSIDELLEEIEADPFNAVFKYGIDPALPWLTGDGSIAWEDEDGNKIFDVTKDGKPWPPEEYGCEEVLLLLAFYNATAKNGKEALQEIPFGGGDKTAFDALTIIAAMLMKKAFQIGCTDLLADSAHLIYGMPNAAVMKIKYMAWLNTGQTFDQGEIAIQMANNDDVFGTNYTKDWSKKFVKDLNKTCKYVYGKDGYKFWVYNSAAGGTDGITQGSVSQGEVENFKTNHAMVMDFNNYPEKSSQNLKLAAKMRAVQLGYNSPGEKQYIKGLMFLNPDTPDSLKVSEKWDPLETQDPFADAPWLTAANPFGYTVGPGQYAGLLMQTPPPIKNWIKSLYFASVTMEMYLKSKNVLITDSGGHELTMEKFKDWYHTVISSGYGNEINAGYVEFLEEAFGDLQEYLDNLVEFSADI